MAAQAAAFNDRFVQHLSAGAFSYTSIEAALASFLQDLQELPAIANGWASLIASDPYLVLFSLFVLPAFTLFGAFWIGVILGLVILFGLYQQLIMLLASFGI